MGEKSISVVIANRTYPLSVKEGEEPRIQAAARRITDMLREFEATYAVRDKQDLLAMCALNLATSTSETDQSTLDQILAIDQMLDEALR